MTQGLSLIGQGVASASGASWSVAARTDGAPGQAFYSASAEDVSRAVALAAFAARPFGQLSFGRRAEFLRAIAEELEADRDAIIASAHRESALPVGRFEGEFGRTTGQLRATAQWCEDGAWADIRKDEALPDRAPLPRPDLRSWRRAVGPVAVFGASNFPLAFSVAGGDTASALAAGCPVIAKAHPAHPETSERAGLAIQRAAARTGMPEGVFSLLFDDGYSVGQALVQHPAICAVGFTGSRKGGLALVELASKREKPIPVFAEMSSINPVFVMPGVLKMRPVEFAKGLAGSVTLGVGQFCTNPGVVFVIGEEGFSTFVTALQEAITQAATSTMLTDGITAAYHRGLIDLEAAGAVALAAGKQPSDKAAPAVLEVNAAQFELNPTLHQEVFGPSTLIVRCESIAEAIGAAQTIEGQLTATLHMADSDLADAGELFATLEDLAGRVLVNQFPTGVEVSSAMVHGGPFPSTSDGRSTSVGYRTIERWTRLICYQNIPESLLPEALR